MNGAPVKIRVQPVDKHNSITHEAENGATRTRDAPENHILKTDCSFAGFITPSPHKKLIRFLFYALRLTLRRKYKSLQFNLGGGLMGFLDH